MKKYEVIDAYHVGDFQKHLNAYAEQGYILVGSPMVFMVAPAVLNSEGYQIRVAEFRYFAVMRWSDVEKIETGSGPVFPKGF